MDGQFVLGARRPVLVTLEKNSGFSFAFLMFWQMVCCLLAYLASKKTSPELSDPAPRTVLANYEASAFCDLRRLKKKRPRRR